MLLVSTTSFTDNIDRNHIDRMARDLVLDAYHSTGPSEPSPGQAKFDAALDAYHRSFPYVSKAVARQAVAVIIASMEDA